MDRGTFWGIVDAARDRAGAGADDRGAEDDPLSGILTDLLVERLTAGEMQRAHRRGLGLRRR
ncbi:hypothetical protein ACFWI1_03520 [Cellulosimicrobium cellulans]|uniref:hypothetical protein n=1 Tax=Cellulosimicrobium cellulans TaxID=1710 RepID=UPI00365269EA